MTVSMATRQIHVAVCHYQNDEEVLRFVERARAIPLPAGYELRIGIWSNDVDACAGDAWRADVFGADGRNHGYLNGAARAVDALVDAFGPATWTVVCNTDVRFDADAWHALVAASLDPEAVWVIAPDIRLPDGRPQNPFLRRRYSRARAYAYVWITWSPLLLGLMANTSSLRRRVRTSRKRASASAQAAEAPVYAPHGSAMIVSRGYFDQGGALAYPGFLYGEEIHVAEQVRALGGQVRFVPAVRVLHDEHGVIGGVPEKRRRAWLHESAKLIWYRYFAPVWWPGRRDGLKRWTT